MPAHRTLLVALARGVATITLNRPQQRNAISCAVALIVVVYTFATALAGTATDVVIATVLFGSPLLCVAIFGLLTLRITENRRSALEMAHSVGS
jgi:hypothetical protein